MRKIVFLILSLLCATAYAQQGDNQPNLGLIPTPQKVEMGNGFYKGQKPFWNYKTKRIKVDSLPAERNMEEAYQIVIDKKNITVRYITTAGWNYACYTLQQLEQLYDTLPCMTITDWPAYRYRVWMDDQSRGPVPHSKYRHKQQWRLERLKYNAYTYYTEHTLYQEEYPDLAPAYAHAKNYPRLGTQPITNLQLFAHAEKTLRIPYYQHLMDSRANFNPANEETYTFLFDRIVAAMKQTPSEFFIINCDETEQLGSGRAKQLVDSLGADQVYVDHINRCCELIERAHYLLHQGDLREEGELEFPRVLMWGDIVAKNPAMMKQLPEEMTYIMWAYEPLDSYDHLIKPFADNGTPFWVAPSLSHSSNMIPNPQRYMKNIANLARDGYKAGAEGLINTCWDDNGEALFDNCWHGLYWSAEMAWNPLKTNNPEELKAREEQFNRNFERLFYGKPDSTDKYDIPTYNVLPSNVSTLYQVGTLENDTLIGDWYTSAALMEPLLNFNPDNTSPALIDRVTAVKKLIASIEVDSAANPHAQYALHRIKATAQKAVLRYVIYHGLEKYVPYAEEYFQTLTNLKREYLRLWDQENGEYERYIVCNRYDDLAREVLELDRHVFMDIEETSGAAPKVRLRTTVAGDRPIYYTLDGSEPNEASTLYEGPFPLERSATIRAIAYNEYGEGVITSQYLLSHLGMGAKATLQTPFSTYKAIYSGGGENALTDGIQGSNSTYADGHWQGYWGDSIDAVIDFGKPTEIRKVSMRFMQNTFDWILGPTRIKVYTSDDGRLWRLAADQPCGMDPRETGMRLKHHSIDMMQTSKGNIVLGYPVVRYLRVVVPNPGTLPDWHPAPGQPSYLFCDEIVIE